VVAEVVRRFEMRKFLFALVTLLALASLSIGQIVNDGIRTRIKWEPVVLQMLDTVVSLVDGSDSLYIVDSIGYADFELGGISEQGFATMVLMPDSADSISAWFSSGCKVNYFGTNTTAWSTDVQCIFDLRCTARTPVGPINIAFLQSEALVDTSDRQTGYMPADKLRITVTKFGGDTTIVPASSWPFADTIVKLWFK
jgi:hypothetical protein